MICRLGCGIIFSTFLSGCQKINYNVTSKNLENSLLNIAEKCSIHISSNLATSICLYTLILVYFYIMLF